MSRNASVILLTLLLLLGFIPLSGGGGGTPPEATAVNGERTVTAGVVPTPDGVGSFQPETENQSTNPRHRNPSTYDGDGNAADVQRWLSDRLTTQLERSTLELTEGQYERAQSRLGDEYRTRLAQYVEVAGDTDTDTQSEDTAERFADSRNRTATLINKTQEYEETRAAYERALANGNRERARVLARELIQLAADIESVSADLEQLFAEIENSTTADLSTEREALATQRETVAAQRNETRSETFVETDLEVTTATRSVSFRRPLAVNGTVRTAGGDPVSNGTVQLILPGQNRSVSPTANGRVQFNHRPTALATSDTAVTLQYVPPADSIYLGSAARVNISVQQVTPTVVIDSIESSVQSADTGLHTTAYDESVSATGSVTIDGVGADGVPVVLSVQDQQLGRTTTTNGTYTVSGTVPADIPAGTHRLRVAIPYENRTIAGTTATRQVRVDETATSVSLSATADDGQLVRVSGALETADGQAIPDERLAIQVNGSTVTTVTTAANGSYQATVPVPDSVTTDTVTVRAVYAPTESNLSPSRTETMVTIGPVANQASTESWLPIWVWIVAGLLATGTAGLWMWRTGYLPALLSPTGEDPVSTDVEPDAHTTNTDSASQAADSPEALLRYATTALHDGRQKAAARACYAAVLRHLEATIGLGPSLTHWEVFRAYRTDVTEDGGTSAASAPGTDALRRIITVYEQAVFSTESLSTSDIQTAITLAGQFCDIGVDADESGDAAAGD